jgi:hypothetical protein
MHCNDNEPLTHTNTKVFTSDACYGTVCQMLPYLAPNSQDGKAVVRSVSRLEWNKIYNFKPFYPLKSDEPAIIKGSKTKVCQWLCVCVCVYVCESRF